MSDMQTENGKKKKMAYALMAVGGVLFALAIIIPTEQGSKEQMIKIGVGLVGLVVFFYGSYKRPTTKVETKS